MKSTVADLLKLRFFTVAIPGAMKSRISTPVRPGPQGMLMSLFAQAALGKTAVIDRETFGYGGGVGAGFGNQFRTTHRAGWNGSGISCRTGYSAVITSRF